MKNRHHAYRAAYRLEIHFTETGKCYAEVHDADFHRGPLWESKIYEGDDLDDCLFAGRYEVDRRAEMGRETAHVKGVDE